MDDVDLEGEIMDDETNINQIKQNEFQKKAREFMNRSK